MLQLSPTGPRRQEQREYYSQTAAWTDIHPSQMLGPGACFKQYDLRTVTLEEPQAPLKVGYAVLVAMAVQPAVLRDVPPANLVVGATKSKWWGLWGW